MGLAAMESWPASGSEPMEGTDGLVDSKETRDVARRWSFSFRMSFALEIARLAVRLVDSVRVVVVVVVVMCGDGRSPETETET